MSVQADLRERGWRDPQGLMAFTRNSSSPDLWIYFDAADHTSPVNVAATKVLASCEGGRRNAPSLRVHAPGIRPLGCSLALTWVPSQVCVLCACTPW